MNPGQASVPGAISRHPTPPDQRELPDIALRIRGELSQCSDAVERIELAMTRLLAPRPTSVDDGKKSPSVPLPSCFEGELCALAEESRVLKCRLEDIASTFDRAV